VGITTYLLRGLGERVVASIVKDNPKPISPNRVTSYLVLL